MNTSKKILVFDNYDSFTYNLVHAIKKLGYLQVDVYRNDEIALDKVDEYDKILLSPGPGVPSEAGELLPLIKRFAATKSILGVCLGHQAIGEAFGGTLLNLDNVHHGISSQIKVMEPDVLFKNIPDKFEGGRYHSWVVAQENFPTSLKVIAVDANGEIMALRHQTYDVCGVQFHPESVLTPMGETLLLNWLES